MPRIRYQVAMSLDGYIAGPNDEFDWIIMDPDIDFDGLFAQFDTFVMGRRTYEIAGSFAKGGTVYVFSRSMRQEDHPNVTIVREVSQETVAPIRARAKKDIWLFGGGELFRSFLDAGLVDTVEPAIIPVVLGAGKQFLPGPAQQAKLTLTGQRVYEKSGIVLLEYACRR